MHTHTYHTKQKEAAKERRRKKHNKNKNWFHSFDLPYWFCKSFFSSPFSHSNNNNKELTHITQEHSSADMYIFFWYNYVVVCLAIWSGSATQTHQHRDTQSECRNGKYSTNTNQNLFTSLYTDVYVSYDTDKIGFILSSCTVCVFFRSIRFVAMVLLSTSSSSLSSWFFYELCLRACIAHTSATVCDLVYVCAWLQRWKTAHSVLIWRRCIKAFFPASNSRRQLHKSNR